MTGRTELKRLADSIHGPGSTMQMLARWREFESACEPKLILALIAENEALKGPHDWLAEDLIKELVDNAQAIQENADDGEEDPFVIVLLASASRIRRQEANIDKLRAENERLKAENAGLKTGYEAYEQVNAELKAEVEALREEVALDDKIIADRDRLLNMFDCPAHGQCIPYAMEQIEALRKDAERYRAIRDEIPHVDLGRSIVSANNAAEYDAAIDAALGQGVKP